MTGETELEHRLTTLFASDTPVHAPIDLHASAMARVGRTRQRTTFMTLVRGDRLPGVRTFGPARTVMLVVAALILAAVVGAVIGGGSGVTPVPVAEPTPVPSEQQTPVHSVQPTPEVIIPAGVTSTQTVGEVMSKMLAAIAANEQGVGRALAPPRIIRIQLLRPGESYVMRRLDGTGGIALRTRGSKPAWVVEAVGTFVDPIGRDGGLVTNMGTHGIQMWGDGGLGGYDWFPCWVRTPGEPHADSMEGECGPPSP